MYKALADNWRKLTCLLGYPAPEEQVQESIPQLLLAAAEDGDLDCLVDLLATSSCSVNTFNSQVGICMTLGLELSILVQMT